MKYAIVSNHSYPVIRAEFQKIEPSVSLVDEAFDDLERICRDTEGQYILLLINQTGGNWVSIEARKQIAFRYSKLLKDFPNRQKALVLIFPSLISRLVTKGINLFLKKSVPQYLFSREENAQFQIDSILHEIKNKAK